MAQPTTGTSARFRQRKISVKQTLQVLWQSDVPDLEDEQQRELQQVETGVEKGEEEEHHLQAAITASIAASSGAKVEQVYIPTPDASKVWKNYSKYYKKDFSEPSTYIRLSATVEETSGIPYCMDEVDEKFLNEFNAKRAPNNKCTEDEFELIMYKFEDTIAEKQPFLSMDPTLVMSYEEMSSYIIEQITEAENDPSNPEFLLAAMVSSFHKKKPLKSPLASFKQFSEAIYPHWKERKIARKGKPIFPVLKVEDSEKDDSDPYVCFRRREVRQVRKTRRTDTLSSEKLRKLKSEMENAKQLMEMVVKRETMRREALQTEHDIFESRVKMKDLKRSLNIKGDDEDLVTHKKRKTAPPPAPTKVGPQQSLSSEDPKAAVSVKTEGAVQHPLANTNHTPQPHPLHQVPPNVRLPASKVPDMELVSLEKVQFEKESALRAGVKDKLRTRAASDKDWVNFTDNPYIPFCEYFDPDETTRNSLSIIQPSHAAYSSITTAYPPTADSQLSFPLASSVGYNPRAESNSYLLTAEFSDDGDLKVIDKQLDKREANPSEKHLIPRGSAVSLRKRVGRGGRILVDRKGLVRRPKTLDSIYDASPSSEEFQDELKSWSDISTFGELNLDDAFEKGELLARVERLEDRYKYDSDIHFDNSDYAGGDPSRLNGISEETQSIRFGSMLMSKAYDSYWDAFKLRQQHLTKMQKVLQQQQAQQHAQQQQQQAQQAHQHAHQVQQQQRQAMQHAAANGHNHAQAAVAAAAAGKPPVKANGAMYTHAEIVAMGRALQSQQQRQVPGNHAAATSSMHGLSQQQPYSGPYQQGAVNSQQQQLVSGLANATRLTQQQQQQLRQQQLQQQMRVNSGSMGTGGMGTNHQINRASPVTGALGYDLSGSDKLVNGVKINGGVVNKDLNNMYMNAKGIMTLPTGVRIPMRTAGGAGGQASMNKPGQTIPQQAQQAQQQQQSATPPQIHLG